MDGVSFDDNFSVKEAIVNFYNKLYEEDHPSRPFLEGLVYDSISEDDACDILREFTEDEVWKAINDLGREKTPLMVLTLLSSNIVGILLRKMRWVYFRSFTPKEFLRRF